MLKCFVPNFKILFILKVFIEMFYLECGRLNSFDMHNHFFPATKVPVGNWYSDTYVNLNFHPNIVTVITIIKCQFLLNISISF